MLIGGTSCGLNIREGRASHLGIHLKQSHLLDDAGKPSKETPQRAFLPRDPLCVSGEKAMGFVTPSTSGWNLTSQNNMHCVSTMTLD